MNKKEKSNLIKLLDNPMYAKLAEHIINEYNNHRSWAELMAINSGRRKAKINDPTEEYVLNCLRETKKYVDENWMHIPSTIELQNKVYRIWNTRIASAPRVLEYVLIAKGAKSDDKLKEELSGKKFIDMEEFIQLEIYWGRGFCDYSLDPEDQYPRMGYPLAHFHKKKDCTMLVYVDEHTQCDTITCPEREEVYRLQREQKMIHLIRRK